MRKLHSLLLALMGLCFFFPLLAQAETIQLRSLSVHEDKHATNIFLESSKQPVFKLFTLENPERVVLDIQNVAKAPTVPSLNANGFITKIRTAKKDGDVLRIVLDARSKPFEVKASTLLPDSQGNYELQLSITHAPASFDEMIEIALKDTTPIPHPNPSNDIASSNATSAPVPHPRPVERYKPIVIIDAGHGGHDPGSIGRRGTKEKDLTLAYARALFDGLKATGNYRPILTRSNDIYIPLQGRVSIARKYKADLFISLHADSHNNPHVKGMSVYSLSDTASDKEAAALARRENKSDIISGINLQHEDRDITNVLISIAQRDTMNQSAKVAEHIVKSANNEITLLRNPHRFAGFRVLTAADVPSVLVEMGYLSNHREEKLLNTEKHKKELVRILIKAINAHFEG